jgi:hypothetical protein
MLAAGIIEKNWIESQMLIDCDGIHLAEEDVLVPFRESIDGAFVEPDITLKVPAAEMLEAQGGQLDGGDILCTVEEGGLLAEGGERHSHGSGGFVTLRSADTERVIWIVAFARSNPICSVAITGGEVVARSTSGLTFRIPLSQPAAVAIVRS